MKTGQENSTMKKIDYKKLMNERFPCDMCGRPTMIRDFAEYSINDMLFLICPNCKAIMDM